MKPWNTYLALITSQSFWESSSCFRATWDDKLLHILCNSFICSLASAKSVSKFCKESIWNILKVMCKKELKTTMHVIYIYRHMDVHIHAYIYCGLSKYRYMCMCACMKNVKDQKKRHISNFRWPPILYCRKFSLIHLLHVEGESSIKSLQSNNTLFNYWTD